MTDQLIEDIEAMHQLLCDRERVSGDLPNALNAARRSLPKRIYRQGCQVAEALPLLRHPRLKVIPDIAQVGAGVREVTEYLEAIDLADRRRGWFLGVMANIVFSLFLALGGALVLLRWQGFL